MPFLKIAGLSALALVAGLSAAGATSLKDVKDLWLPQSIYWYFSAMLAIGQFDARYHLEYHDYRQATTSGRIKGGGRP